MVLSCYHYHLYGTYVRVLHTANSAMGLPTPVLPQAHKELCYSPTAVVSPDENFSFLLYSYSDYVCGSIVDGSEVMWHMTV